MARPFTTVLFAAIVIFLSTQVVHAQESADDGSGLDVTIRNVMSGQPITPPVVIVHNGSLVSLPEDPEAISGLPALAESGDPSGFAAAVAEWEGVKSATIMDVEGPLPPGSEATQMGVMASPGDYVSVIGMVACTNDAITYATARLSADGGNYAMSSGAVWDAGTEANDETRATIPCLGGAAAGLSEGLAEGKIAIHPGIVGEADLSKDDHGWDGPGMQIFVTPAGEAAPERVDFGLTIENLTGGQPITPPVVVVHDPAVDVFHYESPTELDGIDDLAEGGLQGDLVATLSTRPGVVWAYAIDSGGPIGPGGSFTVDKLYGVQGADVTVVGMFACTNDAYIRATGRLTVNDGVLAFGDPVTALVFDSGSETNDETMATVPCLGGGEAALSEGLGEGTRSVHAGIVGTKDLSKDTHGWTADATALLTVHAAVPAVEDTNVVEVSPAPEPAPPVTGDYSPSGALLMVTGIIGALAASFGVFLFIDPRRKARQPMK